MKKLNKFTTTLMATSLLANSIVAPISQINVLAETTEEETQKIKDLEVQLAEAEKDAAAKKAALEAAQKATSEAKETLGALNNKLSAKEKNWLLRRMN